MCEENSGCSKLEETQNEAGYLPADSEGREKKLEGKKLPKLTKKNT
jgi:hypothetical protein